MTKEDFLNWATMRKTDGYRKPSLKFVRRSLDSRFALVLGRDSEKQGGGGLILVEIVCPRQPAVTWHDDDYAILTRELKEKLHEAKAKYQQWLDEYLSQGGT